MKKPLSRNPWRKDTPRTRIQKEHEDRKPERKPLMNTAMEAAINLGLDVAARMTSNARRELFHRIGQAVAEKIKGTKTEIDDNLVAGVLVPGLSDFTSGLAAGMNGAIPRAQPAVPEDPFAEAASDLSADSMFPPKRRAG